MKNWRLGAVLGLFVILAAIIIGRLFYIQIVNGKFYQSQALGQQSGFAEVQGDRGEVFFSNSKESRGAVSSGEVKSLAINKDAWTVGAVPKNISDKETFAKEVGKVLQITQKDMLAKLAGSDSYVILKKEASSDQVDALKKLNLNGLSFDSTPARYYPQESLAAQVIGFVGGDGTGQYGIEGYYQNILQGKSGIQEDKRGLSAIDATAQQDELNGSDLYLTIDYNIQFEAEQLLRQAAKDISIASGQIIVVKPDSGRILALANYPSFNPNDYSKENLGVFQDAATQKIFEPGSVFKPLPWPLP